MIKRSLAALVLSASLFAAEGYTYKDVREGVYFIDMFEQKSGLSADATDVIIKRSLNDRAWQEGNIAFFKDKKIYKGKQSPLGELERALASFSISAKKGNLLSAFEGANIISQYYFANEGMKKKYLTIFSDAMVKGGMCLGVIYKYDAIVAGYYGHIQPFTAGKAFLEKSRDLCFTELTEPYQTRSYRHRLTKATYIVNKGISK